MNVNYNSAPDIQPDIPVSVDTVMLFQRFRQDADIQRVDELLDQEVKRHIRLCELAILYAASTTLRWCKLPDHPIEDVMTWTIRHLEERGFKVEHHERGREVTVQREESKDQTVSSIQVSDYFTASWFLGTPINQDTFQREWQRRCAIEDQLREALVPLPQSRVEGEQLIPGNAIWAALLDNRYIVEVQEIVHQNMLCIFDLTGGRCLHKEPTEVAFGALFGPDVSDVASWQERAQSIVDGLACK